VGADEVLYPEDNEAQRLARTLMEPNIIDHISITDDQSLIKVVMPTLFFDKSIVDLNLRGKYGVTVMEVSRRIHDKDEVTTLPPPDFIFRAGDILVVIGEKDHIEKFRKICAQ
jgi:trk system potassium uptake protein TrkA